MITQMAYREAKQRAADLLGQTGVSLTQDELAQIAVADFGLGDLEKVGAQILTLLDSPEIAAKLIVLFPWQVLPEHRHPPLGSYPGKAEALRCEFGTVYLYVEGVPTPGIQVPDCTPTTARHEVILTPGQQATLAPNTFHWFRAGAHGAVIWSFSSRATDVADVFTDPVVRRDTVVGE